MAKFGEGDKRWIVQDRPDGANVHNWHWSETDCLEWSRNLLSKLLSNLIILNGEGNLFIKVNKVEKLEGEAYVNVRKGKVIPGYELNLFLSWEGEAKESDGKSILKVDGSIEFPYISDENADEDPEIKFSVKDDGPIGRRIKEAMVTKGKEPILEKVRIYVQTMIKGGPAKDDLKPKKVLPGENEERIGAEGSSATPIVVSGEDRMATEEQEEPGDGMLGDPVGSNSTPVVVASAEQEGGAVGSSQTPVIVARKEKKKTKEGFKSIALTEKFNCSAKVMFEILMDENRWKGFTQSNAKINKDVGGEFSIFDGSVTGRHLELQEGKLIVQEWRFSSWPDGIVSKVTLTLDEPQPGTTVISLTQTDIPEEDRYGNATVVENTERGWKDLIFNRIRAVFGFGI